MKKLALGFLFLFLTTAAYAGSKPLTVNQMRYLEGVLYEKGYSAQLLRGVWSDSNIVTIYAIDPLTGTPLTFYISWLSSDFEGQKLVIRKHGHCAPAE